MNKEHGMDNAESAYLQEMADHRTVSEKWFTQFFAGANFRRSFLSLLTLGNCALFIERFKTTRHDQEAKKFQWAIFNEQGARNFQTEPKETANSGTQDPRSLFHISNRQIG